MTDSSGANVSVQKERKKPGRVPTSCAECRRLKLRCDRKVPCESCSKRGCGNICPTGSLTTGKGNRLILSNTAELHNKIELMSARIRELEEALRRTHTNKTDDMRPSLPDSASLASQSSAGKTPSDTTRIRAPSLSEPEADSVIDALGTLTIGTRGETTFMSSTARAEYLIGHPLNKALSWATLVQSSRLPARVLNASVLEQDIPPVDDELRGLVMSYRPQLSEAIRMCEIYLEWGRTLWLPLSRHELLDEIVGSVYRATSYDLIPDPHALSFLFSIFALSSLFDLRRPAFGIEAYEYYMLSRVALEFSSPCKTATLYTVFSMENNLQWLELSDLEMDPSRTYIFAGLGIKCAYRMGLHLHSARFQLEKSIIQKRNMLFWQMFLMDTVLSFHAGRPPNVSLDWIDAPYPDDEFPVKNEKGELEMGFLSWAWRFSKLLHEVLVAAFGAKIPAYSTILELDRRIRDFPIPSHLQLQYENDTKAGPQVVLQRFLVLTSKESVLLNIHRRYFSQALQDSPTDPLKHRYGPSVMAAYRSAWRLIVSHSSAVNYIPDVAARIPILWSQAFSAAIIMCMIVTRAPNSGMAASSREEINVVYEAFKKTAPTARVAAGFMEPVERVWRKSNENIHHPCSEYIISRAELDRVGGGSTSLISKASNASSPSTCPSAASSPEHTTPCSNPGSSPNPSLCNSSPDLSLSSIHPRIMQDMQSFEGFRAPSTTTGGLDYTIPKQFSQSMIDTQLSQFCVEEAYKAQALNTFHPAQPPPYHLLGETHLAESAGLDQTWQSFMEQLGL